MIPCMWHSEGKIIDQGEDFGEMKLFYNLNVVVIISLYTFVQTHEDTQLKGINLSFKIIL